MNCPDYNSSAQLKQILDEKGFSMQKKFGQNFLINGEARKKIIDALDIDDSSYVWEVGPGLGSMTSEILSRGSKLTAFEIDRGFISLLNGYFLDEINKERFKIIEGDALKNWKKEISECSKNNNLPNRFFGNLPYNIAATLIADTIEQNVRFEKCVFTVQKEVALRMRAKPGSDDYSSFSVLCQWAYNVSPVIDLAGANFWPKPNVGSQAVLMTLNPDFPSCSNPLVFMKMQRALFSSRRKTVRNNLSSFLKNNDLAVQCLNNAGIDVMTRAEVLPIKDLLRLSDEVAKIYS